MLSMFERWPALPIQALKTADAELKPMATFSPPDELPPIAARIAAIRASNPSWPNGMLPDAMFTLWPFACWKMIDTFSNAGLPMLRR